MQKSTAPELAPFHQHGEKGKYNSCVQIARAAVLFA